MKALASIIREARKESGLRVNQLANRIGVDDTYITHIEHGGRLPSFEVCLKLEKVLGIDCQSLYFKERFPKLRDYIVGKKGRGKSHVVKEGIEFIRYVDDFVVGIKKVMSPQKAAHIIIQELAPSKAGNKRIEDDLVVALRMLRRVFPALVSQGSNHTK